MLLPRDFSKSQALPYFGEGKTHGGRKLQKPSPKRNVERARLEAETEATWAANNMPICFFYKSSLWKMSTSNFWSNKPKRQKIAKAPAPRRRTTCQMNLYKISKLWAATTCKSQLESCRNTHSEKFYITWLRNWSSHLSHLGPCFCLNKNGETSRLPSFHSTSPQGPLH